MGGGRRKVMLGFFVGYNGGGQSLPLSVGSDYFLRSPQPRDHHAAKSICKCGDSSHVKLWDM